MASWVSTEGHNLDIWWISDPLSQVREVSLSIAHKDMILFEPTCAYAQWTLRSRFLSVCL